ncbi:hypothetical protein [Kordiimonas pumila]|uniref:Uncharacterized protein n=1 Tax=Kordiimonas pumila TaxID=2161677 RepID=A0ABV7D2N2_9PROT|nr:hypothetical protein [Kordiimonas pumila]
MSSANLTETEPIQPEAKRQGWLRRPLFKKVALQYLIACNAEVISNLFEAVVKASVKAIDHMMELL